MGLCREGYALGAAGEGTAVGFSLGASRKSQDAGDAHGMLQHCG